MLMHLHKEPHDFPSHLGVQIPGRFIGEDELRRINQSPRNRHPLLLATRELPSRDVALMRQANMIQKPGDALTDFPARSTDGPQHKGNIIKSGAIRQQLEVLKD
jgi:hypothetical protein